jgi:hypothetical protein
MKTTQYSQILGVMVVVLTLGVTAFMPSAKVHADVVPVTYGYNQYQYGTYTPVTCSISTNTDTIENGQAGYLTWSSYGATTAVLNDGIGNVAVNGSLTVRPASSRTYVLTVYGAQGQAAQCATSLSVAGLPVYANTGVTYRNQQVYGTYPTGYGYGTERVTLSQIPYTGFDFGTTGDAVMWLSIMSLAASAAYLLYYYRLQRA